MTHNGGCMCGFSVDFRGWIIPHTLVLWLSAFFIFKSNYKLKINNKMKSKEEILYDLGLGLDPESDIFILNAMEEYAQQFNVNCNLKEDTCNCDQKQIIHVGPNYKECGKCGKRIL